jgi:hypothetical protein
MEWHMFNKNFTDPLYLLNLTLLAAHEIDSAYWEVWNLFHLPGGIQVFLAVNFVLLLIFIFGYRQVVNNRRSGAYFALALAGVGLLTAGIHGYFYITQVKGFSLPASQIVLALILVVSGLQIFATLRAGRDPQKVHSPSMPLFKHRRFAK